MVGEVSRGEQVCKGKEQVYQGCIWLHLTEIKEIDFGSVTLLTI